MDALYLKVRGSIGFEDMISSGSLLYKWQEDKFWRHMTYTEFRQSAEDILEFEMDTLIHTIYDKFIEDTYDPDFAPRYLRIYEVIIRENGIYSIYDFKRKTVLPIHDHLNYIITGTSSTITKLLRVTHPNNERVDLIMRNVIGIDRLQRYMDSIIHARPFVYSTDDSAIRYITHSIFGTFLSSNTTVVSHDNIADLRSQRGKDGTAVIVIPRATDRNLLYQSLYGINYGAASVMCASYSVTSAAAFNLTRAEIILWMFHNV